MDAVNFGARQLDTQRNLMKYRIELEGDDGDWAVVVTGERGSTATVSILKERLRSVHVTVDGKYVDETTLRILTWAHDNQVSMNKIEDLFHYLNIDGLTPYFIRESLHKLEANLNADMPIQVVAREGKTPVIVILPEAIIKYWYDCKRA